MLLIDTSYFQGKIEVGQKSDPAVALKLNQYISIYEPEFLACLLGYSFYKAFIDGVTAGPAYQLLRDGGDVYTNRAGYAELSTGLRNATLKTSPIANYVYWKYMSDTFSFTTGSGEKELIADRAVAANASWKMVRAWNQMVDWNLAIVDYLEVKQENYPLFGYTPDNLGILKKQNVFNL